MKTLLNVTLLAILTFLFSCHPQRTELLLNQKDFLNPPQSVKVHAWWHWIDGAITKEGITKDLEVMKKQGIVQATILNISLFKGKNFGVPEVKFNTPRWYEMFQWALQEADRLGIHIGIHNCDGWSSSGGPWITPELSMKQFMWTKTFVNGGKDVSVNLSKPYAIKDYYRDVAVVAYKSGQQDNSFHVAHPKMMINDSINASCLYDGNPVSSAILKKGDFIKISFDSDFTAEKIVIHPRKTFTWNDMSKFISKFDLLVSEDGEKFKKIQELSLVGLNKNISIKIPATKARYFKLELTDMSDINDWLKYNVAEVELLKENERPLYSPSIPYLLEKTVCVKSSDKKYFDTIEPVNDKETIIEENAVVDLTGKMSADGTLNWNAPEGNWCVLRFGYTTTGAVNGPATKEGEGLECDKMDTAALNFHFKNYPEKLIQTAGKYNGNTFKFFLIDSWECAYQNWTQNFPSEFEKLRNYKLINWIPVLCGETVGSAELSEGFLYDFRKTIADLIENNYYKHFSELCHQNHLELHCEVIYGDANYPPLDILKSNSYIDLPMFEFWSGHNKNSITEYTATVLPVVSFPAYSSVLYDKPVIGSEAYTAMAHYSESPSFLKPFGDRAFCSGINQLILHSSVHQPLDKQPGMTLGPFASHFNRNNPYWNLATGWITYQSRIQYVLQNTETVSDILYFIGDQLPQFIDNNFVDSLPSGYYANACNYDILKNKATVKDGKINLSANQNYSILILADNAIMELSSLQRIAELVKEGAIVYGNKPFKQLSLKGLKENKTIFAELADQLWGKGEDNNKEMNEYGKGKIFWGKPIAWVLKQIEIHPDFGTNRSDSLDLMYIHKTNGKQDIYFVFNQQDRAFNRECVFRMKGKVPEIWNPETGTIVSPSVYSVENDQIRIPVSFKPRESFIFVFTDGSMNYIQKVNTGDNQIFPMKKLADSVHSIPQAYLTDKGYSFVTEQSGEYNFTTNTNNVIHVKLKKPEVTEIKDFKGMIEFTPAYDAVIKPVEISNLKSYTDFPEKEIKYFSGFAKYTIEFKLPEDYSSANDSVLLNFGNTEATAKITLNGQFLSYLWMPGTSLNVNGLLKQDNKLEIVIANTFRNRIIGDYIEFGELKNVWTSAPVNQFLDKNKPLKPSGVIGPLQIIKYPKQIAE